MTEQTGFNSHIPWTVIAGYGSHIKATRDTLKIHQKGVIREIPINRLNHLLIIGGHTIQTSAINTLLNTGVFISLYDSEGGPTGVIEPYGYRIRTEISDLQDRISPYSYALTMAKSSVQSKLLAIEAWNEETEVPILYSGELDVLKKASDELDNLVKIEEIRRIERLITDMYYEIMSRKLDPNLGFKRRTERPYHDPVNAILSYGYAILSGACTRALMGAHLNPDSGLLNRGKRGLTFDFVNCWKNRMVDQHIINFIKEGSLLPDMYENSANRCILTDTLIHTIIPIFQKTINQRIIDEQIAMFVKSLKGTGSFEIIKI